KADRGSIKPLPRQGTILYIKEGAVGVRNVRSNGENLFGFTPVQRSGVHPSRRVFSSPLYEKKVFSIGKKVRVAVGKLAIVFISWSRFLGRAAPIGYPLQRTANFGREE